MNKKEFISKIAEKRDLTKTYVAEALNMVLDEITDQILEGEDLALIGFGHFKVEEVAERKARNPQTGEMITVPPHRRVKFKPSKNVRDNLR